MMNYLENNKEICFVIMPFGGFFDEYYENIYKPAIEESNLEPFRADNIYKPSTIIRDIWNLIQGSSIIIADLTKKNANVFYELGLSHASKKPVIFIAESMDDVPFDLRAQRVITYNKDNYNWGQNLKEQIIKSINETLQSPLESVLPIFLEVKNDEKVSRKTKEYLELKSEIDLLKQQIIPKYNSEHYEPVDFTSGEIDILKMMSKGYSQVDISNEIGLSLSGIEKIINHMKIKTNSRNTIELIVLAKDLGVI